MINDSLTKDLYVGNGENNKNKEIALLNPLSKDNSVFRETLIFMEEATKHNTLTGIPQNF